jgi:hypothetical protein
MYVEEGDVTAGEFGEFLETPSGPGIRIASGVCGDWYDQVLAHEIIHSWLRITGIVDSIITDIKQEELVCNALGPLLVQLLKEFDDGEDR